MKTVFTKAKRIAAAGFVLLFLCAGFFGCAPAKYFYDPFPDDFEGTKWVCREADIVFYVPEGGSVICTCTVGETTCRGYVWDSHRGRVSLYAELYEQDAETGSRPFANRYAVLSADYHYDEETGTLVLSNARFWEHGSDYNSPDFPETLTFDRAGTVATTPSAHWVADEMDLYLDSFDDAPFYYRGEIVIDGETHVAYAVEESPNFFWLTYDKGNLIYLDFDVSEDRIVATVDGYGAHEEYLFKASYPTWYQYFYDLKTITVRPTE